MSAVASRRAAMEDAWRTVLKRVEVDDAGCWLWSGSKTSKGYGEVVLPGTGGTKMLVHRLSLLIRDGSIPEGHVADHTCHVPSACPGGNECHHRLCVNPAHLEAVTIAENSRRGAQQNRRTCKVGHRLTYRRRGSKIVRCCRQCESAGRTPTAVPA